MVLCGGFSGTDTSVESTGTSQNVVSQDSDHFLVITLASGGQLPAIMKLTSNLLFFDSSDLNSSPFLTVRKKILNPNLEMCPVINPVLNPSVPAQILWLSPSSWKPTT